MLADLQQGVPWGAEGQEISKMLLGEEPLDSGAVQFKGGKQETSMIP